MIKKIMCYLIGMFVACTGVGLVLQSNIGAGPWDAVYAGVAAKTGLTIGISVIIGQIIFLLINSALLKKRPAFESAITFILWGFVLDFCTGVLLKNADIMNMTLISRWAFFLVGVIFIGMGIGLILVSKFPTMPYDGTMMAVVEKFGLKINVARTILEGIGVVLGFVLGGPVGIGSIVFVFFLGGLIQYCKALFEKLLAPKTFVTLTPETEK